jgi:hypothetical protein
VRLTRAWRAEHQTGACIRHAFPSSDLSFDQGQVARRGERGLSEAGKAGEPDVWIRGGGCKDLWIAKEAEDLISRAPAVFPAARLARKAAAFRVFGL